mgnify:FL=1
MHINKYTIRNLSLDDCKSYLQFSRDIINEGEFILTHKDEFNYNISEEKKWIIEILKNENNISLVATINDEIIGSINILQYKGKKISHIAELNISVHKDYRNMHIGKSLLDLALNKIKEKKDIRKIILYVFENNHRAIHLYSSFDFNIEGTLIDYVNLGANKFENLLVMGLFNKL